MRVLIQRVTHAEVSIEGKVHGSTGPGLLVLVGVTHEDTEKDAAYLAQKCVYMRIFEDENGKMNRSLLDVHGGMLIISQFTLYGDATQGRRPFFGAAAEPVMAEKLYQKFIEEVKKFDVPVGCGVFGADMKVELCNDGPVTLMVDSRI